ncbi:MAG: hypothetical protein JY451_12325 [Erythrobacter sp.]|nr:MAG: hypothetical protein JY451_12325 [Erythrobacter sp.]
MKTLAILAIGGLAFAAPALAAPQAQQEPQAGQATPVAEVIARDDRGRATRVRVDGREYDVCEGDQADDCINPREAGLNFGNVPIDYWPGRPASEIDGPLPAEAPQQPEG